jgi:hypothetical protein
VPRGSHCCSNLYHARFSLCVTARICTEIQVVAENGIAVRRCEAHNLCIRSCRGTPYSSTAELPSPPAAALRPSRGDDQEFHSRGSVTPALQPTTLHSEPGCSPFQSTPNQQACVPPITLLRLQPLRIHWLTLQTPIPDPGVGGTPNSQNGTRARLPVPSRLSPMLAIGCRYCTRW